MQMFRDLDTAGAGAITQKEFRQLLQRQCVQSACACLCALDPPSPARPSCSRSHLDIGLSDAQLLVLMSRFPAAPEATQRALGQPAISWIGFVEVRAAASRAVEAHLSSRLSLLLVAQSLLDAGTLSPEELERCELRWVPLAASAPTAPTCVPLL